MEAVSVRVVFKINYFTNWGESVAVVGDLPELGLWTPHNSTLKMSWVSDGDWEGEVLLSPGTTFSYKFGIVNESGKVTRWEDGANRTFTVPPVHSEVHHVWQVGQDNTGVIFQSSAFQDVVFGSHEQEAKKVTSSQPEIALSNETIKEHIASLQERQLLVLFRVSTFEVGEGQGVYIVGNTKQLGAWYPTRSLPLQRVAGKQEDKKSEWAVLLPVSHADVPFEYKFIIRDEATTQLMWETGKNRVFKTAFPPAPAFPATLQIVDGSTFRGTQWRGAGVAVPVFSLRSKQSLGVGEFMDLKFLIDWGKKLGLHLIQVLPVNDTTVHGTWWDSYPYSSISVFALHPIYVHLEAIGDLPSGVLEEIEQNKAKLDKELLDYEAVIHLKLRLLREIYEHQKKAFLSEENKEVQHFLEDNKGWLPAYALFSHYKQKYGSADYNTWPEHQKISEEEIVALTARDSPLFESSIGFYYFVQYHLSKQLSHVANYAAEQGVIIKGDLPIGVDPLSVDVWVSPHLFNLDTQTGAPPDYFAVDGQNWGFPTYNWEVMAKDNYLWWRRRLAQMEKYFHAYRIDHVLGFFRIWEIPFDCVRGLLGHFSPSIPLYSWEFEKRGIENFDRLCEPFITTNLLHEAFGADWEQIAKEFLVETTPSRFAFKPEYDSEKKIEAAINAKAEKGDEKEKEKLEHIKRKLWDLIGNVILLRKRGSNRKFYPRIGCLEGSSFSELEDEGAKNTIRQLYYDYFYERQDVEWAKGAKKKLGVMRGASRMLICVEDLGMIPKCVQGVLDELALIGLRVQRMPADPATEFGECSQYPYLSVCTPSTHDTSPVRGWWEEDYEQTQRYHAQILKEKGPAPKALTTKLATKVLSQHLNSDSIFAIFAIQDFFATDERLWNNNVKDEQINIPAIRHHYWRYRIPVKLEDLQSGTFDTFTHHVQNLIKQSGRA